MSVRAASSSAARVRSRLSPFGLPRRGDGVGVVRGPDLSLATIHKIVHLFNKFAIGIEGAVRTGMTTNLGIEEAIAAAVGAGELAGAAALVWRKGAVEQIAAVGRRDLVSGLPV